MNIKLIHRIKGVLDHANTYRYNHSHHKLANHALKTIESIKGRTNPVLIKTSNEYAKEVLGWNGYAPWLRAYSAMTGDFREGWLPENYFGSVVVPKLQGEVGKTSLLKSLSKKLFHTKDFPDVGYFVNGSFYSKDCQYLKESNVTDYIFKDSDKIIFKLNNSAQGKGIFVFDVISFRIQRIKVLGDGIFQEFIQQHSFFNVIIPNSVATLRMLTVLDEIGEASIRAIYLRVGRSKDSHVSSASQISIPVNIQTGELNHMGHSKSWFTMDSHPDTGFKFEGKKIPGFERLVCKALNLQNAMPFVKCIGWDMILDANDDVQIMEWNGYHTGIGFAEFTQGPCFKDLGWENLWKD